MTRAATVRAPSTSAGIVADKRAEAARSALATGLCVGALSMLGVAACAPPAPPPPPPFVALASETTTVRATLTPFSLQVLDADGREVGRTTTAGASCAPLAVALVPDDQDGAYFRPDAPDDGLQWLRSGDARRADAGSADALVVDLLDDDDGAVAATADVRLTAGAEGFVDVDVAFDLTERAVALSAACFAFGDDEHAVGGGERFTGVDVAGSVVELAFAAPGKYSSTTNEAHAPVPFLATSRGLGLLVETERPGAFDVAASEPGALHARFRGTTLPLRLAAGRPVDVVAAHARRMGLPPMPPLWALAPMQWRNEAIVDDAGTGRDRVLDDAYTMRQLGFPATAIWIDAPWQTGYNTFRFNETQFPDPAGMIEELERGGFRVLVWATEHVNVSDDQGQMPGMPPFGSQALYERFRDEGRLVGTASGAPLTLPWGRGQGAFVDFTNAEARDAWVAEMMPLLDLGVRGFKLDYGESMRPDVLGRVPNTLPVFSDGTTTEVQHTRYARLYHETYLAALQARWPDDWFVITRTGGIHDQKNGVAIWPGDLDNDFLRAGAPDPDEDDLPAVGGLPAALHGVVSLSVSGYPLAGSDIGGYRGGPPTTEALIRWAQLGAVSTVFQLGGGGTGDATHNPWDGTRYDPPALDAVIAAARWKMDLLPTFHALLFAATTTGAPPLVPTGLMHPDVADAWADRDSFFVGADLLAAPVVEEGATTRTLWVPPGAWLPFVHGGDALVGPATTTVDAPLAALPLYVRAGAVVFLGDPRLQTAASAGDDAIADVDSHGATRVALTSPGPASSTLLPDGVTASQSTVDGTTTVTVESPDERLLVVDLRGVGAATAPGLSATPTATEADLYACVDGGGVCALIEAGRTRLAVQGTRLVVEATP